MPALEAAVFRSDLSGLAVRAFDVGVDLPVGLSGAASIPRPLSGKGGRLHFVMGLLPHATSSLTFVVGVADDESDLIAYEKRWMQHALEFLSMVESWMINGTDQWYLRPSVWDKMGTKRQESILQEIEACSRSVHEESEHAIFDDVRQSLLPLFEVANQARTDDAYLAYVQKHRDKSGRNVPKSK